MRRYAYLILFLLVLVAPLAMQLAVRGRIERPAIAMGGKPAGTIVILSPHNPDIRREFARAFNAWHIEHYQQPVELDYRNLGGTGDIARYLASTYQSIKDVHHGVMPPEDQIKPPADIVWGGGDYFFDNQIKRIEANLKGGDVLQPLPLSPQLLRAVFPDPTLAGVRLYDYRKDAAGKLLPPRWVGVCLSSFGIVYNPDLYRTLKLAAPQMWSDLDKPQLSGLIALADPTHSGSVAVAYRMVLERTMADAEEQIFNSDPNLKKLKPAELKENAAYMTAISAGWKHGMSQLLLMAANARYFTDSATAVPNDVASGDAAAGVAIDFYGRVTEAIAGSDRIRFVSPAAATAITPDPVGILNGVVGEQRTLCLHFVEFLLSRQGQLLWILKAGEKDGPRDRALGRTPIRRDVYDDRTGWADDVNPFEEAGGFNQHAAWGALQSDIAIMIWGAAWIDAGDALRAAHQQILAIDSPARRAQLLGKLADLPIKMEDIDKIGAERAGLPKDSDLQYWKTCEREKWASTFRKHYHQVAAKARTEGQQR